MVQVKTVAVQDKELTAMYKEYMNQTDVNHQLVNLLAKNGFILTGGRLAGKVTASRNACAGVTFYTQTI